MSRVVKLSERAKPKTPFDDFWQQYPRRIAKGASRKAFDAALKITTAEEIILGAIRFADYCKQVGTEPRYIPHPSTWLNGERWEDELEPPEDSWSDFDGF